MDGQNRGHLPSGAKNTAISRAAANRWSKGASLSLPPPQSFQNLLIPVSWPPSPLRSRGVSRGRTRRGQWPGIKPGQSGGEEGVKREHTGEGGGRSWGGWEVGSRRALDDKFSAIGSFDADSPTKSKARTCDTWRRRRRRGKRGKEEKVERVER